MLIAVPGLQAIGASAGKDSGRKKGTKIVVRSLRPANQSGPRLDYELVATGDLKAFRGCLGGRVVVIAGTAIVNGRVDDITHRNGDWKLLPIELKKTASTGDRLKLFVKKRRLKSGVVCKPARRTVRVPPGAVPRGASPGSTR